MKYKLINNKTKEEHLCDKITIDGFDYYTIKQVVEVGNYAHFHNGYSYISKVIDKIVSDRDIVLEKMPIGREKGTLDYREMDLVISTNNPNIDIPKVIEKYDLDKELGEWKYRFNLKESVEKADKRFEEGYSVSSVKDKISHRFGYAYGIKEAEKKLIPIIMELKSQETHPNSDEDMKDFGYFCVRHYKEKVLPKKSFKELLQLWKDQKPKIIYYE